MVEVSRPAFDKVVDALRNSGQQVRVDHSGTKARAACPAHGGDRKDALLVTDGPTRVLLHCFTRGCDGADILDAVGLTVADRYHEPRATKYEYTDFSGLLLRTVTRKRDKQFPQDIRDGSVVPLYHLPQLAAAVAAGEPVYLVEGEEDVHALEAAGVTATTAPMGSGSFHLVNAEPLRGATVIAIVDKDKAGQEWASQVSTKLAGVAASVEYRQAKTGKDASDHVAAELGLDDLEPLDEPADPSRRQVVLTPASEIKPRRVQWLWDERLALGTLGLLAGREGVGKSTAAYWLVAQITRGTLPGEYVGQQRGVLVCATEDSWDHTIVPRLMAAGADLTRVFRVEVIKDAVHVGLSLPRDIPAVERAAKQARAGLLLLDPLMSRIDEKLDSHQDQQTRQALEPLAALADRVGMAVVGLCHHNKSGTTDPLSAIMGSRAFASVARSVHTVLKDPDDESGHRRLFGTPKNNLGKTDLPTLVYTIESHAIPTDDGTAWTGKVVWSADSSVSIHDAMRRAASDDRTEDRSAATEATDWLRDHLERQGGAGESGPAKRAAKAAGHSDWAVRRAREVLAIVVEPHSTATGRVTLWLLPESVSKKDQAGGREDSLGETLTTTPPPPPPVTRGDRVGHVGVEGPRATPLTTPHDPAGCLCGAPLRTFVQRANGQCNRCYVEAVARNNVDREPAA